MQTAGHSPALLVFLCLVAAGRCQGVLRIPKTLHRNYMAGADALYAAANDPQSNFKAQWLASCKKHNPHWKEIIWDAKAVRSLVEQDFPWFLPTYLSYPKLVQRSDVTRYMVLYKYGGVYLDADVECYGGVEQSLQDRDLVLNCEYQERQAQMHNAAMASVPGHPFWLEVLREAMQRAPAVPAQLQQLQQGSKSAGIAAVSHVQSGSYPQSPSSSTGSSAGDSVAQPTLVQHSRRLRRGYRRHRRHLRARFQQLWEASPFHNKHNAVLWSTGPMLITSVYKKHVGGGQMCGRTTEVAGLKNHVYELGSWFTPCYFNDVECIRRWTAQQALLVGQQLQEQQGQQGHMQVVGIHHYSGSWTAQPRKTGQ